jgi:hypothetical protein
MTDSGISATSTPVLSVVVAIVSDTTELNYDLSHLIGCLQSLGQQTNPPPFEIIVPYPSQVDLDGLESQFPEVEFILVDDLKSIHRRGGSREHHDELRARGLLASRGEIIGLLEDHARPDQNWCNQVFSAHKQDYAGIGGAIENGIDRPTNWAAYFCDFSKYQNPVREGNTYYASDANISYKRNALEPIRSIWQDFFHETEVNWAIRSRGEKLALSPEIVVYQFRKGLTLRNALKERFIWGRSYAATRSKSFGLSKRLTFVFLSVFLPGILLARMAINVFKKGRNIGVFVSVFPVTLMFVILWSLGEMIGYLTARVN